MKSNKGMIIIALIAVAAVVGYAVWQGRPDLPPPEPEHTAPESFLDQHKPREQQVPEMEFPLRTPRPATEGTEVLEEAAEEAVAAPAAAMSREELLAYLRAQLDVMEEEGDIEDGEMLAKLLEQTAFPDWYEAASEDQRMSLIDMLMENEAVREHVAELLAMETNSDLRSYLLDRTDPIGLFDDYDIMEEPPLDEELAELLRQQPITPMDQAEWFARLELAGLIHDLEGVRWAEEALRQRPDDFELAVLAHILILGGEQSGSLTETADPNVSRVFLAEAIMGDAFYRLNSSERERTYLALMGTLDAGTARDFLQEARHRETDPHSQQMIDALLRAL